VSVSDPIDRPYVGLDPFEAEHADYFFGRTRESKIIADHVLARRITVLYGPSGIGKTSILNVGLPSAFRQIADAWRAARERLQREEGATILAYGASNDWLIVRMRNWQDPEKLERDAIAAVLNELGRGPLRDVESLRSHHSSLGLHERQESRFYSYWINLKNTSCIETEEKCKGLNRYSLI
jgi:hypothetical protein